MDKPHLLKTFHSTALPAKGGAAPDWIQVFPAGAFTGRDGRGPYVCEPEAVIARTRQHNGSLDIPVDYDHQLEFSAANGQPAPAAGWITELAAREDGIWGRVEWTEKGRAHVAAREYRYVSPVYYYDEPSGVIQSIESVALTNVPNLTMKALASRGAAHPFTGESSMSFLKTLASVLGVTDAEPTEAAVEAAARRVVAESGTMKAAMSVMAEAAKADDRTPGGIAKAVQSVAARAEHPDVTKYVPAETFNTVNAELSRMKAAPAPSTFTAWPETSVRARVAGCATMSGPQGRHGDAVSEVWVSYPELADILGDTGANLLCVAVGGASVPIPRAPVQGTYLAALLGMERMGRLCAEFRAEKAPTDAVSPTRPGSSVFLTRGSCRVPSPLSLA